MTTSLPPRDQRPGFYEQLLRDERRHHFYSRALGWVMLMLLAVILLLGMLAAASRAPEQPECRAATGALPGAIPALRLELSRDPAQVRRLLRGEEQIAYPTQPPQAEALCVEARAARYRELLGTDSAIFIPVYVMLGFSALAWYYFLALRARGPDWARRGRVPRALIAGLLVSAAVLALAAGLDTRENREAHAVLDEAVAGATPTPSSTTVEAMQRASVAKWAAVAVWAGSLALLSGLRRRSLSLPRGSEGRRRWAARMAWGLLATGLCATGALGAGVLLAGLGSDAQGRQAVLFLAVGFAAVFMHAIVLWVLHRLHLPRRLVLQAPPDRPRHTERAIVSPEPL